MQWLAAVGVVLVAVAAGIAAAVWQAKKADQGGCCGGCGCGESGNSEGNCKH